MDVGQVRAPIYVGPELLAPRGGYQLKIKLADHVRGLATADGLRSLTQTDLSDLLEIAATEGAAFRTAA